MAVFTRKSIPNRDCERVHADPAVDLRGEGGADSCKALKVQPEETNI